MPGPITFTALAPGDTVTAAGLNTNFERVNTAFDDGIANTYIANPQHNFVLSWHLDSLAAGTRVLSFKVPATYSSTGLTPLEAQLYTTDVGAAGVLNVNIHTASPPSGSNSIMPADLVCDADGELVSSTTFSANSFGGTFTTTSQVYVEFDVTVNSIDGIVFTLFGKAENRS